MKTTASQVVVLCLISLTAGVVAAQPGHNGTPADVHLINAPDIVLFNGRITTLDEADSEVSAIAMRDGRIIATGNDGTVRALADHRKTKLVNLHGRRVLPGLIDGHIHGMRNAYHCYTQTVRLDLITSRAEALALYAAKADELEDGEWIWTTFGGWSLLQLDDPTIFTFAELSAAAPNNPIWLTGSGGFSQPRVNQAALDALGGLSLGSPGVDAVGRISGSVAAQASAAIRAQLDAKGIEGEADCLADFIADANARGLTAWKDADGNEFPWPDPVPGEISIGLHVHQAASHLHRTGNLNARIAFHQMSDFGGPPQAAADTRNSLGFLGDDMFRYLGQGEDTDGADPDYFSFTEDMVAKRLSVETHVGNHDAILNGFEHANGIYPIAGLHWMISHPSNGQPTDLQLERAAAMGIGYSLTFSAVRNGGDGARYRSTMLKTQQSDLHMCLASDSANVSPWAPFQSIWYVTTGHTLVGAPGVIPSERLTRMEALRHATVECAWFLDLEGELGTLEAGKYADMIVLSDDYFAVPEDAIKDLTSDLTIVDGRVVHASGPFTNLGPATYKHWHGAKARRGFGHHAD